MRCSIDIPTQISGVLQAEMWDERTRGDYPLDVLYAEQVGWFFG